MWRGHNYVLYLVTSLDFLAGCEPGLGKWLAVPLKRNPLLQTVRGVEKRLALTLGGRVLATA